MLYIVILLFLSITFPLAIANTDDDEKRLAHELSRMTVRQRLDTLNALVLNPSNYDKKFYPHLLLEEAERADDPNYKGTALLKIAEYYYTCDLDSLLHYITLAEKSLRAAGRINDICRSRGWYIYALSNAGETDKVLEEVEKLRKLAKDANYIEGIDMANQALADFNIKSNLRQEGYELYEQIFRDMEERNAPLSRKYSIVRQLLNNPISEEKKKYYLDILEGYIKECEDKKITSLDENTPLFYVKYIYFRSRTVYHILREERELAYFCLRQAYDIVNEHKLSKELLTMKGIELRYYSLVGDFRRGKPLADTLMQSYMKTKRYSYYATTALEKAKLSLKTGNYKDAAETFAKYIGISDSINNAGYHRQMAQMRSRHDLDHMELKNKKMEIEMMRSQHFSVLLLSGIFVLIIFFGLLVHAFLAQKKRNKAIREAKKIAEEGWKRAEEADQMKSSFLANMNHEIRTPLNAITGFSQVLIDEEDPELRKQYAQIVMDNNELLQRLIADVLDLSKIESNSMQITYKEQNLPDLMNNIYNVIRLRMPENVELRMDPPEPLTIDTDRNRLTQILTNLLTNSIKHTKEGYIRFGYRRKGEEVEFFVQDTGEGIPDDKIGSIFNRFVKLDDWTSGVGLGLSISQGLAQRMGGRIRVTSKLGEGSVFYVSLPTRKFENE